MIYKNTAIRALSLIVALATSFFSYGEEDPASIQHRYMTPSMRVSTNAWLSVSRNVERIVSAAINGLATKAEVEAHVTDINNPHSVTAAQVGALPLIEDSTGAKTAVTIGSRKSDGAVGASSLANGNNVTASGQGSHAEGLETVASGVYSHADGMFTEALGPGSYALGYMTKTLPSHRHAFVWNGYGGIFEKYTSNDEGTFNINPIGGLDGFYIGEKTLAEIFYTKEETDAKVNAIGDKADEAYSAAEQMVDAVNSLAGTIGTHTRDTKNPHKVTAAQVGALPISGGTLTGNLAVGEEHTASRKLTVAAENGANGITLQGGVQGTGSNITIGGSDRTGGTLTISGGLVGGGKITVDADDYGQNGGSIEVTGPGASIKKDGKEVATESYVDAKVENAVLPTNPTFSNAVLSVGLNIDTDSVAVLNEIASTFGGFPIEGTATTVGGLLAALAAAVAWLRKKKIDKLTVTGMSKEVTADGGVAKLDDFFTESNSLLNGRLAYSRNATGLKDRAFNTLSFDGTEYNLSTALAAVTPTASGQPRDLLIVATATAATTISFTAGTIKGDKPTIDGSGTWLITLTEYASGVWYCRQIKMEDAA